MIGFILIFLVSAAASLAEPPMAERQNQNTSTSCHVRESVFSTHSGLTKAIIQAVVVLLMSVPGPATSGFSRSP